MKGNGKKSWSTTEHAFPPHQAFTEQLSHTEQPKPTKWKKQASSIPRVINSGDLAQDFSIFMGSHG